jgi:GNAT superfamily N-acetyltransferase
MAVDEPKIERLTKRDYGRARTALGQAFFDYNLMCYAAPDARRRLRATTSLYGALLADCFRLGEVYVAGDCAGVACWLPPEHALPTFWRQARSGMLALPFRFGVGGFRKLLAYDEVASALHHELAPRPHWFLDAIGVVPTRQGQGVGSALMRPMLERADRLGIACYLDTHQEQNVRLYQRHGFEIARRADVPGHPVPVWAMVRPPRR